MKKIKVETKSKRMLADVYTPVGIYLRLRDRFRDTILLESTDHHAAENSYSFICINAIAGIEIRDHQLVEYARHHGLKVIVTCPFAKKVFEKKPEWGDVLEK